MNIIKKTLLPVIIICCMSCNNTDYAVQINNNIPNMTWYYDQASAFSFNIADTSHPYILGLCIRYNNDYPDANLYTFIHTTFPNGEQACDTVSIDLFMPDGTPAGNGRHMQELNVNISRITFPQLGDYRIEIEQATRHDTLPGIASIGIYLINEPQNQDYGTKKENE